MLVVGAAVCVTVAGTDRLLTRVVHFNPPLREVADALSDYDDTDPTVLVLGSSHARSFEVMGEILSRMTSGRQRMLAVPLEWGKVSSYEWLLRHRLAPRIEETDAGGHLVRPSLRHFILVTEWWDTCPAGPPGSDALAANLPARAWVFSDFLEDVLKKGLTDYNKNYLNNLWTRALIGSVMIRDRGHETIKEGLRALVSEVTPAVARAAFERRVHDWHRMLEGGADCMGDPREMAALEVITSYFQARGVDVTIVLYPKMPITVTSRGTEKTLRPFSERMAEWARDHRVRLLDWTLDHPLNDEDWEVDFDHLTPKGNRKLSEWALAGGLAFLVEEGSGAGRSRSVNAGSEEWDGSRRPRPRGKVVVDRDAGDKG